MPILPLTPTKCSGRERERADGVRMNKRKYSKRGVLRARQLAKKTEKTKKRKARIKERDNGRRIREKRNEKESTAGLK